MSLCSCPQNRALILSVRTAAPDAPTADGLKMLACWGAAQEQTDEVPAVTERP